jgi:hypothetical protein
MKSMRLWSLLFGGVMATAIPSLADTGRPATIEERARGANRVVVATVAETSSRYERNEFGDEMIVTYARLAVEENLKGQSGPLTLAIEGGTVDGITMRVSSLPSLSRGERAVFFVTPGRGGEFKPHLRGQGILKLTADDRVPGSSLTLNEIRRLTHAAKQEQP